MQVIKEVIDMRKFFLLLSAILLLSSNFDFSQRRSSFSFKSHNSFTYKVPKITSHSNSKYEIGGTKYKAGETYKSSGLPKVERSRLAKKEFLKSQGYSKTPSGYEVDHIIPLSKGGQDKPSNMQLLPKEVHKQKTANERKK